MFCLLKELLMQLNKAKFPYRWVFFVIVITLFAVVAFDIQRSDGQFKSTHMFAMFISYLFLPFIVILLTNYNTFSTF